MLVMNENDIKQYFGDVIRKASQELKIKDWEWIYCYELLEIIKNENNGIYENLQSLFKAYTDWYNFHVKIDKEGKQGNLSPDEHTELMKLIENRDNARQALIAALAS